jgi:deazaflavin-dependent oxidoreductase (nitroreductase family)
MLFGAEHVQRYVETDGREGYIWREGTKILILTTTGRISGEPRSTPLIYQPHGEHYIVVGSNGGNDVAPDWYQNLAANPDVEVQVLADRFAARARTVAAEEKPELWELMVATWPHFVEYQGKTERDIPVVVLERT